MVLTVGDAVLQTFIDMATNAKTDGTKLVTGAEVEALKTMIKSGTLPVWRNPDGATNLYGVKNAVETLALLPEERAAIREAVDALEATAQENVSRSRVAARLGAEVNRLFRGAAAQVKQTFAKFDDKRPVSDVEIADARQAGDPEKQAAVLYRIIAPYVREGQRPRARRVAQMEKLLDNLSAPQIDAIRAAYVASLGTDPVIHIIGGAVGQSFLAGGTQGSLRLRDLARRFVNNPSAGFKNVEHWAVATYQKIIQDPTTGPDATAADLMTTLLGASLRTHAEMLAQLSDKVARGEPISAAERRRYFSELPFIGIRTRSERPRSEPTLEEQALRRVWQAVGQQRDIAEVMRAIEAKMPDIQPPAPKPGQRSVAVIVSSQGAQWQELMGYVMEMQRHGVHVQLFTPAGRPAAFQLDSLSPSTSSSLGYGAPPELDPRGPAGMVARRLLGDALPARAFDAARFDQVFVAGGLGLNEDGFPVQPRDPADRQANRQVGPESVYDAHPDLARMITTAARRGIPMLAICHGPSAFIAEGVALDTRDTRMAALGPFEAYVAFTGRTGRAFQHMALVHHDARRKGVVVDPIRDAVKPSGVVRDIAYATDDAGSRRAVTLVTGPHPLSSRGLGLAGLELLGIPTADRADFLYRRDARDGA